MWRAKAAGLMLFAITGRPAGWCDHIARMWPGDAVVGENGAFYFRYDTAVKKLERCYVTDAAMRRTNRTRLDVIATQILCEVPGSAMATDQAYREADIAIDYCEDVTRLPVESVLRIKRLMETAGLTAKISSIHVNGWFGEYDKLTTTKRMMRESFGVDLDTDKSHYVFVGDSPNDQSMFGFFPHAVGVANVRDLVAQLDTMPAYVSAARCGAGFVEVVAAILDACPKCDGVTTGR